MRPSAAITRSNLAGTADKLKATWKALRCNFLLALLITYLLMAALFESWLYPFVIILSVPLGAVGGLAGLALLNFSCRAEDGRVFVRGYQSLDVLTMLGLRDPHRHGGQQPDPHRPSIAEPHARGRHDVPATRSWKAFATVFAPSS